jgi:hypothetical protein
MLYVRRYQDQQYNDGRQQLHYTGGSLSPSQLAAHSNNHNYEDINNEEMTTTTSPTHPSQRSQSSATSVTRRNSNNPYKTSTAQPRPALMIPPRGIGPIREPNSNDVLCGRGGRINAHSGNVHFRTLVQKRKRDYLSKDTRKLAKAHIAADLVHQIRQMEPAGRFLKEDADGMWFDIGE